MNQSIQTDSEDVPPTKSKRLNVFEDPHCFYGHKSMKMVYVYGHQSVTQFDGVFWISYKLVKITHKQCPSNVLMSQRPIYNRTVFIFTGTVFAFLLRA